ncbi:acyl-CoA dehydrogenase family protein [Alteromonas lipolytica]|uniref:Acyl-CoA dehydrogenase n=1 Tax=Alteromonas lipolytica TaxID=1856405 RepID=A0A1E8FEG9_9ALTE|nr:acyl-CoA dehydrogenase family protein [Alteromonas lipolytica]OFI34311.1 hypothetical protein BFC17_18145 [Alteromonas lipolytica]GGF82565.1 acyl-CoA dehydrogenase [Alteromonas lipolytica]
MEELSSRTEQAPVAEDLRLAIREWLSENFPPALAVPAARETETELVKQWRTAMGEKGWCMPTWPKQYGGGGFSKEEVRILNQELERIGAYNPVGTRETVFGETLKHYGTEEQKSYHLPKMVRGEFSWCQGFSEPGAGSDLAGLQMKAEETPEGYLLNGQKIWTSGATESNWCFCLVRTDTTRKHDGISFILVDMNTPGFEVRPIRLIDGSSPFCELFLTDVLVPKENILGEVNKGWEVAKFQLQVERTTVATSKKGHGSIPGPGIKDLACEHVGTDDAGRLVDADLRSRIASHLVKEKAFNLTFKRAAAGPAVASVLKNAGSDIRQTRAELSIEVLGHQGLGWSGDAFTEDELAINKSFLFGKSASIAAGSFEIQYNILSKRILGLPEMKSKV